MDSTGTKTYLRDGEDPVDDVLSDGSLTYNPGISSHSSAGTKFEHQDYLGTNKVETDSSQNVAGSRSYDAFGNPTSTTGSPQGPFGFAGNWGYQEDPDSGLKLLGHRYYDPSTGRFLTRDPIHDGRNWYGYCNNRSTGFADGNGHEAELAADVAALAEEGIEVNEPEMPWSSAWRWLCRAGRRIPYLGPLLFGAEESDQGIGPVAQAVDGYPSNDGFVEGTTRTVTLPEGTTIQRVGGEGGFFVSPPTENLGSLSLPPDKLGLAPRTYQVVSPIGNVITGEIQAWFDQEGGGQGYKLPSSIIDLKNAGNLKWHTVFHGSFRPGTASVWR